MNLQYLIVCMLVVPPLIAMDYSLLKKDGGQNGKQHILLMQHDFVDIIPMLQTIAKNISVSEPVYMITNLPEEGVSQTIKDGEAKEWNKRVGTLPSLFNSHDKLFKLMYCNNMTRTDMFMKVVFGIVSGKINEKEAVNWPKGLMESALNQRETVNNYLHSLAQKIALLLSINQKSETPRSIQQDILEEITCLQQIMSLYARFDKDALLKDVVFNLFNGLETTEEKQNFLQAFYKRLYLSLDVPMGWNMFDAVQTLLAKKGQNIIILFDPRFFIKNFIQELLEKSGFTSCINTRELKTIPLQTQQLVACKRMFASSIKFCWICEQSGHLKCSECLTARYCSAECQKKDWAVHKCYCKLFKN